MQAIRSALGAIGGYIVERWLKSYKSSLVGLAVTLAGEGLTALATAGNVPPIVHGLAGIVLLLFLHWRDEQVREGKLKLVEKDPPRGTSLVLVLGALAVVSLLIGLAVKGGVAVALVGAAVLLALLVLALVRPRGSLLLLIVAVGAGSARAQEAAPPASSAPLGGCSASGNFCAQPAIGLTLAQYGFRTKQFSAGASPGLGYEAAFWANKWYRVGIELRASLLVSQSGTDALFSLPFSFARYIRAGPSYSIRGGSGEWGLVFGVGLDVSALVTDAGSVR